jgi:hypothetical protein
MLTEHISVRNPENALYIDYGPQPVTSNIGLGYSATLCNLYASGYMVPQLLCVNIRQEIPWPSLLSMGEVQSYGLSEIMAGETPSDGTSEVQPEAESSIKSECSW